MKRLLQTLVLMLLVCSLTHAQLSGPLSGTLGPGVFTVVEDISVEEEDTLIIQPGTDLLFNEECEFDIYGYLSAVGTVNDSVIFAPSDSQITWKGIDFHDTVNDASTMSHCKISGSIDSGLKFDNSSPRIFYCSIFNCSSIMGGGGIKCSESSPIIQYCSIFNNSSYNGGGIECWISDPLIKDCIIRDNSAEWHAGGVHCSDHSNPIIEDCLIFGNTSGASGGGILCRNESNAIIENCTISDNYAFNNGGGISLNFSYAIVKYCRIENNTTEWGGGISCSYNAPSILYCNINNNTADRGGGININSSSHPTITNCTITGNQGNIQGGGIRINGTFAYIKNTIIENNFGFSGLHFSGTNAENSEILYCDLYNNENGNIGGTPSSIPPNLGTITTININGDSCDAFQNIFEDPLFYSTTGDSAYYLTANSPCIDAGDPNSPLDPDSTRADMGAYYYNQAIADITITLTPFSSPIQIPANGGTFDFNIAVQNIGQTAENVDIWTMVTLPNGTEYGPIINFQDYLLNPGANPNRDRTQTVPANAPPGSYTYNAYIGDYPDIILNEDHFNFVKQTTSDGGAEVQGWKYWGEEFESKDKPDAILNSSFLIFNCSPNPFNPKTAISYQLLAVSNVNLTIYDITGREVQSLVNGHLSSGKHTVVWDASGCGSGVYFARLTAGDFRQTRKMLLVK